ncbi:MAG: hypothetical protein ABSH31_15580, partial [Bryobacteraceae bacterium]
MNSRKSFPLPFRSMQAPANLVMASLIADPSMLPTLGSSDVGPLDTSPIRPSNVAPQGLFVVELGKDARIQAVI